jgi:hypothetical protein
MIKRQLYKIGYSKKKLNKSAIEILRNIELICFLNKNKIKIQQNIIIDKLKEKKKFKPFIKYLKLIYLN